MFQFFNLIPVLDAVENASLPLRLDGARDAEASGHHLAANGWGWATGCTTGPTSSPAASSSGSRSPARCRPNRRSCWPTSPPATSTPARPPRSANCCARSVSEWGRSVLMVTHDPRMAELRGAARADAGRPGHRRPHAGRQPGRPARGPGEVRSAVTLVPTLAWRYLRGRGAALAADHAGRGASGVMLTFGLNGILPAMVDAFTHNLLLGGGQGRPRPSPAPTTSRSMPDVVDRLPACRRSTRSAPGSSARRRSRASADAPADAPRPGGGGRDRRAHAPRRPRLPAWRPGRMLAAGDDAAVVLNTDLAASSGYGLGDQLVLPAAGGTARFRVVGLLERGDRAGPGAGLRHAAGRPAAVRSRRAGSPRSRPCSSHGADRAATERAVAAALGPDYQVGGLSTESTPAGLAGGGQLRVQRCSGSSPLPPPGSSS